MRAVVLVLTLLTACVGTAEQRVHTRLEAFAQVVKPASTLAVSGCEREKAALAEAHEPIAFDAAKARCDSMYDVLDQISALHDAASTAVENGDVALAEQLLAQVSRLWRDMRGVQ